MGAETAAPASRRVYQYLASPDHKNTKQRDTKKFLEVMGLSVTVVVVVVPWVCACVHIHQSIYIKYVWVLHLS